MFSFFLLTVNWTHLVFVASSKGISVSTLEHGSGAESSQMELVLRRVWALGSHSRGVARHFHHPRHPHYQHHVLCCYCHLNCPHPIVKRLPWCGLMIWSLRDKRLDSDVTGGGMGSLMLGLSACRRQGSWRMCGCFHHTCSTYTSLCTPLLCVQDYHTACQVWVFPRFSCFLFLFSRLCLCVSCFSHHFLSLSSLVNHSCVFKPHPELVCMFLTCIPVSVLRSSCVPCVPVIDPHSFYGLSSVFVLLFSLLESPCCPFVVSFSFVCLFATCILDYFELQLPLLKLAFCCSTCLPLCLLLGPFFKVCNNFFSQQDTVGVEQTDRGNSGRMTRVDDWLIIVGILSDKSTDISAHHIRFQNCQQELSKH